MRSLMQSNHTSRKMWLLRALKLAIIVLVMAAVGHSLSQAWHQLDKHRW